MLSGWSCCQWRYFKYSWWRVQAKEYFGCDQVYYAVLLAQCDSQVATEGHGLLYSLTIFAWVLFCTNPSYLSQGLEQTTKQQRVGLQTLSPCSLLLEQTTKQQGLAMALLPVSLCNVWHWYAREALFVIKCLQIPSFSGQVSPTRLLHVHCEIISSTHDQRRQCPFPFSTRTGQTPTSSASKSQWPVIFVLVLC